MQNVGPTRWLQVTTRIWWERLETSENPPPDPQFYNRMGTIASAMATKAAAIVNLGGEDPGKLWHLQDGLPNGVLSRELSPGANPPGNADLWIEFDAAVAALDSAMRAHDLVAEQAALEAVSVAMFDVMEELGENVYPWKEVTGTRRGTLAPDGRGLPRTDDGAGGPLRHVGYVAPEVLEAEAFNAEAAAARAAESEAAAARAAEAETD